MQIAPNVSVPQPVASASVADSHVGPPNGGRDSDLVVAAIADVRLALARADRGRIVSLESLARLVRAVRD